MDIVPYTDRYRDDFVSLSRGWIERFFRLEPCDETVLADPYGTIIATGGQIFIALDDGCAVGCCALIHHGTTGEYELAKMAVAPRAQGRGIGRALAEALLRYARQLGAATIFLEANTRLVASVRLYESLGFRAVSDYHPAYDRCDLFMRLTL